MALLIFWAIVTVGFVIYILGWNKIESVKESRIIREHTKKGFMYGIFYNFNETDLFISKEWTKDDALETVEQIKLDAFSHSSIINHSDFRKNMGTELDPSKLFIKEVSIDQVPYPIYRNSGVKWK